jgi:hypothetical protein
MEHISKLVSGYMEREGEREREREKERDWAFLFGQQMCQK